MKLGLLFVIGIFSFSIFQHECDNRKKVNRSVTNNENLAIVSASPTPTAREKSKNQTTSSTPMPICSPQPTPLSEEDKNNPIRELTAEEELDAGLGTTDWDCDGICNRKDICIFVYNPNQKDMEGDGKGDVCDPKLVDSSFKDSRCDQDGDGIPDFKDNCPLACNPDQKFIDFSENGVNDLCDNAFPNAVLGLKPCAKRIKVKAPKPPAISNNHPTPTQSCSPQPKPLSEEERSNRFTELSLEEYLDFGLGNADLDCDGIRNSNDNCIYVYNPDQKDSNGDGKGDACDPKLVDSSFMDSRCDEDADGVPDFKDNCRLACNPDQKDVNKNGIGDVCDQSFPNAILSLQICSKRKKVKVPKPPKPKNSNSK